MIFLYSFIVALVAPQIGAIVEDFSCTTNTGATVRFTSTCLKNIYFFSPNTKPAPLSVAM